MTLIAKRFLPGALLIAAGFALVGCPKAKGPAPETETTEAAPAVTETPALEGVSAPMMEVGTQWSTSPDFIETVYFDYMKAELTEASRMSLKKNAAVLKGALKSAPSLKIRVEGHCDDRGTLEYNMVLSERRAKAVRDYYASLGVAKAALSTIPYGEERPVCTEGNEDCWWRNRRGETTLKAGSAVKIPLPQ
jgi:peptidoglycan-associated lipoprotein